MLEISAVSKTYYTSQKDNGVQALCDINLHLNEGSSLAIVGPSGCGKSSLLRLIAGLAEPTEGNISIFEEPVKKPRKKTAFMLQDFGLLPWKNVEQNVGLALQLQRVSAGKRKEIIDKVLSNVGLLDFKKLYPLNLSGGMKQRLSLARALTTDSDLVLMDEPLSALDAFLREDMQELLKETWLEHKYAQIIVTHSIDEAVFLGERIAVMSSLPGRIVETFDNPGVLNPQWRNSNEYYEMIQKVRESLHLAKVGGTHA